MRLEKIKINNFCSCQSLELELNSFNPIVGYNNSGKSNILKAVNWLLKKSVLAKTNFYDENNPLTVEGEISNVNLQLLPQNQQVSVSAYIHNGILKFRRRQDTPETTAAQIKIDVFDFNAGSWTDNPAGLDTAIGKLFPEPIYIEAMKDASEDVSKFSAKNTIGLLLKYTLKQIESNNLAALNTLKGALDTVTSQMSGPNRIQEFNIFEAEATTEINNFFPGISLHLKLSAPDVDDLMKGATISLSEGNGIERGFSSYGHGAQRSVQMALIQLLAKQAQLIQLDAPTTVLLIDEPELYLHPQAIEILRESLKTLSKQNFQIIFSTHSPLLLAKDDVLDTSLIYKQQNITVTRKKLATASKVIANNPHQFSVLFSLQNSTYLLFSEAVLVIEGKTEKMLLPEIYRAIKGQTLGINKLCLVEAGGSASVYPTMNVLKEVGYKPKALVDLDYIFKIAPQENFIDAANNQDFIDCKSWFEQNSAIRNFNIGTDGFPVKKGVLTNNPLSTSEAYELLAIDKPIEIERLAAVLSTNDIWVWKKGAIEAHLGIQKNDADRMDFLNTLNTNNNLNHAIDGVGLVEFINWV